MSQQPTTTQTSCAAAAAATTPQVAACDNDDSSVSTRKWTKKAEKQMNEQIHAELTAQYAYISMAQYFERNDVALKNISKYFYKCAEEEGEHAKTFINYQNKRGGTVHLHPIQPYNIIPGKFSALKAFQKALELEKHVYDVLLKTHDSSSNDPELTDLIASDFLHEQVEAIYSINSYITNLEMVGQGLGTYMFDRELKVDQ